MSGLRRRAIEVEYMPLQNKVQVGITATAPPGLTIEKVISHLQVNNG